MKKHHLVFMILLAVNGAIFGQVLDSPGVQNTFWMGFGNPLDIGSTTNTRFYGCVNTLQTRIDITKFSVEGMLNWGLLRAYKVSGGFDGVESSFTEHNHLSLFQYSNADDSTYPVALQNFWYVNFLWQPIKEINVAAGSYLNWTVGAAPDYGAQPWEHGAHVRQGGFYITHDSRRGNVSQYRFTPDAPDNEGQYVVGFVHYANCYAKEAIGIRYVYEGDCGVHVGFAVPEGCNTNDTLMNLGIEFSPVSWFSISSAWEGMFRARGNLYAGLKFGGSVFMIQGYGAFDSLFDSDHNNRSYSVGGAITFTIPKTTIIIHPEAAFNWFGNDDYTPAWYAGGKITFDMTEKFAIKCWASYAHGSKNKRWDNPSYEQYEKTKDYNAGHIVTIGPEVEFTLTDSFIFTISSDIQFGKSPNGNTCNAWSVGTFFTYRYHASKIERKKKSS
ncbi:MAG: hypothetical protein J1D88_07800 [Treponema sp.]|nr:hypothetical protein [Treponema sp.]